MDQSPDQRGHVGPDFRGPEFVPWVPAPQQAPPPPPAWPPPPPTAGRSSRPGSRRPAVITAVAVLLVVAVVIAGTVVARYSDTHIAAPVAASQPAPSSVASSAGRPTGLNGDRIDFLTSEGTGQLILLDWSWSPTGRMPPTSGDYLRVQVEVVCSSGVVEYGPNYFQVFDNSGQLMDATTDGTDGPALEIGTLEAGESVRGAMAFDLSRGEATLLMSDGLDQTVTALRIPQ
jgi:hypothetical protein